MPTLADARRAIAVAVTGAGLECLPYPPESINAPLAWVDSLDTDLTGSQPGAGYFCAPGLTSASVVTVAQRHDRAGSVAFLEGLTAPILAALTDVPGLRVIAATSGVVTASGQELPSVLYTVQFNS